MKTLKALSIKQPYASLVAAGIKDIENRSWRTNFRGSFFIHASSASPIPVFHALTMEQFKLSRSLDILDTLTVSAIIGYATIVDCVQDSVSLWAEKDRYHWKLEDAILFDYPLLGIKGKLNFWNVPYEMFEALEALGQDLSKFRF